MRVWSLKHGDIYRGQWQYRFAGLSGSRIKFKLLTVRVVFTIGPGIYSTLPMPRHEDVRFVSNLDMNAAATAGAQ